MFAHLYRLEGQSRSGKMLRGKAAGTPMAPEYSDAAIDGSRLFAEGMNQIAEMCDGKTRLVAREN